MGLQQKAGQSQVVCCMVPAAVRAAEGMIDGREDRQTDPSDHALDIAVDATGHGMMLEHLTGL